MHRHTRAILALSLPLLGTAAAFGQSAATQPAAAGDTLRLEPVLVTAEKREEAAQNVPQSVTVVPADAISPAAITSVKDASYLAPNTVFSEFSNQRLSFPFVRGIGSGRNSPAVTTYIDGVPQLSFATSNQQLYDIDRIEFLRGPQGTLYGRNTIGGVVNIISKRPTNDFSFWDATTFGNFGLQDYRAGFSGPIVKDNLYVGLAGGYTTREGYTKNDFTGDRLDDREDSFGRFQLLWTPADKWDVRFILAGERDRDGDYGLFDLAAVRDNPHHASHDFVGDSMRDIVEPTLAVTYSGDSADFTSITGFQYWKSEDITDLDESPADFIRRDNAEDQRSFTQEFRLGSPTNKPVEFSKDTKLSWLVGAFLFTSNYDQRAGNEFRPSAVPVLGLPFAFTQFDNADLDDYGAAAFGQSTLTFWDKLDFTLGLRVDYEHKHADLGSFTSSAFLPSSSADASDDFSQVVPRFGVAYHWDKDLMTYASAAEGYKSGGFNSTAPPSNVGFDPEKSWTYEAGVKKSWLDDRLTTNLSAFYINWDDMQLDVPTGQPGVFFIDNVGKSTSQGIELETMARPIKDLDLYAGFGYTDSQFDDYTQPSGISADGNDLPFAPHTTFNAGAQYSPILFGSVRLFARADVVSIAHYFYDASNAEGDGYTLANFSLGVGQKNWRVEGWIHNAFDEEYVPLAFPFPLAPSGYVGESGAPRTYGVSLSVYF